MKAFIEAGKSAAAVVMLAMAQPDCRYPLDLAELAFVAAYVEFGQDETLEPCRNAFFQAFADEMEQQRFNVAAVGRGVDPEPQGSA